MNDSNWIEPISVPTLGSANLSDALKLPPGEDKNEWLAVNVIDLLNQVRMIFGVICESECTPGKCPLMVANGREYSITAENGTLNTSAPSYIELTLGWCQMNVDDENVFPSEIGKKFPANFEDVCRKMMRRLFRVYAHVYYAHLQHFREIKSLPHLNTSFKQFILFANQFDLLETDEKEPLAEIIRNLIS